MKYLLLAAGLLCLGSCKSNSDPAPLTPQQMLVGTWVLIKRVKVETATNGNIISKDSASFPTPNPNYYFTFNADGTTSLPNSITADYIYSPPVITYYYKGMVQGTDTVLKLTSQELVTQSKVVATTSTQTNTYFYRK